MILAAGDSTVFTLAGRHCSSFCRAEEAGFAHRATLDPKIATGKRLQCDRVLPAVQLAAPSVTPA